MSKLPNIKRIYQLLGFTLLLSAAQGSSAQEAVENYTEQDRHKAIIMCMTVEYVQLHQEHPAEEDLIDICNARFKQLTQEIPYEEYKQWVLETSYSPYPSTETSVILEKYNHIMLGLDLQTPLIN